MVIVDKALQKREEEENPIRVGIIGAGYMGRAMAIEIMTGIPGMVVGGVSNRTLSRAQLALTQAGIPNPVRAESVADVENAIASGKPAYTDNPHLLCDAGNIDCIVEATGAVEFGLDICLRSIAHDKHLVLLNAEVDCLLGPLLKHRASQRGLCYSGCDGDQPGVIMNLFRWVRTIGYRPVLAGNIKGLLDPYRNPTTQEKFALENKQDAKMVSSFADGTKLAIEMAVVANATGFQIGTRGMYGPKCDHCDEAVDLFPVEQLLNGGLSDYILGAQPGPGVFVLGYNDNPVLMQVAQAVKFGKGPFYCFYVPYHLPHLETPLAVARAVLFNDATIEPLGGPVAEVLSVAKTDLFPGTVLDGLGGYHAYGLADNHAVCRQENLLPIALSEGCVLKTAVPKDRPITYRDVELPAGRLIDQLFLEQLELFKNA